MKKLVLILVGILTPLFVSAYGLTTAEQMIDGINYTLRRQTDYYGKFVYDALVTRASKDESENAALYKGDIVIPEKITASDKNVTLNKKITFKVTVIDSRAFQYCGELNSIQLPPTLISIQEFAFSSCSKLKSIFIPKSVTNIDPGAFTRCISLESIVVEDGNEKYDSRENCNAIITSQGNWLLVGCKNTTIPESVTGIGRYAFCGHTELTTFVVPNTITSISNYAFFECEGLTEITLSANLSSFGTYALVTNNLNTVISLNANPPSYYQSGIPFTNINIEEKTLYVPYNCAQSYIAAGYNKFFGNIVEGDPSGIENVSLDDISENAPLYNLNGYRLKELQRGINIVGRKKVVVK